MFSRISPPLSASMILPMAALVACMDATDYGVGDTAGGNLRQVSFEVSMHALSPDPVCLPGPVYSAHTMYLRLGPDRVRTTPDAVWGFHGATDRATGAWSKDGTQTMADAYPPALARWFWSGPAYQHGADMTRVQGAWLIENGFAGEC